MSKYLEFREFTLDENESMFRVGSGVDYIGRIEKIYGEYSFEGMEMYHFKSWQLQEISTFLDKLKRVKSNKCKHDWAYILKERWSPDGIWVCEKCGLKKYTKEGITTYKNKEHKEKKL